MTVGREKLVLSGGVAGGVGKAVAGGVGKAAGGVGVASAGVGGAGAGGEGRGGAEVVVRGLSPAGSG